MIAPPIQLLPYFLPVAEAETLFFALQDSVTWDERLRARKTASFGVAYNYSGLTYPQTSLPEPVLPVIVRILEAVKWEPNNCLANYYSTGDSSMGFHADSESELEPGTGVVILSLGASRDLVFRPMNDKETEFRCELTAGCLLIMPWGMQSHWRHGVPAQESVSGGRISLTFRRVRKEGLLRISTN